jgi:hypothetical protein
MREWKLLRSGHSYITSIYIRVNIPDISVRSCTDWKEDPCPEMGISLSIENVSRDGAVEFAQMAGSMIDRGVEEIILKLWDNQEGE